MGKDSDIAQAVREQDIDSLKKILTKTKSKSK